MTSGAEVTATGLFDATWYRSRYPDIVAAGIEPVEHYVAFGQHEHRAPNAYFDEVFYLAQVGDIGTLMPLLHYARVGEAADLPPGPYFDPSWYRHAYGMPRSISALAHFMRSDRSANLVPTLRLYIPRFLEPYASTGKGTDPFWEIIADITAGKHIVSESELIASSGLFDANHYLINGSDVHEASLDPIQHFCAHGWQEGRQPNIYFNTAWYLWTNPHLKCFGVNPLVHYILQGEREGRRPVVYFDPVWYRDRYGVEGDQMALAHFLENRRSQRYGPNGLFDLDWYLKRYFQQVGSNRDPFAHYLQTGTYSDVWPSPDFDPVAFQKMRVGRRSKHFSWLLHPTRDNPLIRFMHESYG